MATFVVCSRCGRVQEILGIDRFPTSWGCADSALLCPRCLSARPEPQDAPEVLDEEVIYPDVDDAFDEGLDDFGGDCTICHGPCRGH